eukprot:7037138-Heterocapsa_arctica.AAC.1
MSKSCSQGPLAIKIGFVFANHRQHAKFEPQLCNKSQNKHKRITQNKLRSAQMGPDPGALIFE